MKQVAVCIAVTSLAACGMPKPITPASIQPVVTGEQNAYDTIHQIEVASAGDVTDRMGWEDSDKIPRPDFDVEVYNGGPVIGSLLEDDKTNLVNSSACRPKGDLQATAINVFSSYDISGNLAAQLGLPIPHFPVGGTASRENTYSYSFEDAQMTLLPSDELEELLATPSCSKRVARLHDRAWIVRGLISAKRTYSFMRKNSAGVTLGNAAAGGGFTDTNSIREYGTDDTARVYFMILMPVRRYVPRERAAPIARSSGAAATAENFCAEPFGSKIYIQKDKADTTGGSSAVRQALSDTKTFNVVQQIQAIESDRMPSTSQVRYFTPSDRAAATCVVSILKNHGYPEASSVMLNIASPENQLEVWLAAKGN